MPKGRHPVTTTEEQHAATPVERSFTSTQKEVEAKLLAQLEKLISERNRIDSMVKTVESQLAFMRGQHRVLATSPTQEIGIDSHKLTPTGKMKQLEAARRRDEAGAAIHDALWAKNSPMSRAELQRFIEPAMHPYFNRILAQWNQDHPDQPIRHNGKGTSQRRYWSGHRTPGL